MWALPTRRQAYIAAATARVLSRYSDDEVYLNQYLFQKIYFKTLKIWYLCYFNHISQVYLNVTPSWLFGEERVREIYEKFRKELHEVENQIVERNKALEIPYTVLQPSKIPAGIAI